MPEATLHTWATYTEILAAVITVLLLVVVRAPYGRHSRGGWGPTLPARWGWILMESPAVLLFVAIYSQGDHAWQPVPLALLAMWQWHYVQRTFVYPFLLRGQEGKTMPLLVVAMAVVFNSLNAYVNARWISHFGTYADSWFAQPVFWIGLTLFAVGWGINHWADKVLRNLRKPGETGYKLPTGGLYERITCPNYFGELLEWLGWAIATWSLAGLAFFLYTASNLVPRAAQNHAWYKERFPNYPPQRKRLVPFVW